MLTVAYSYMHADTDSALLLQGLYALLFVLLSDGKVDVFTSQSSILFHW